MVSSALAAPAAAAGHGEERFLVALDAEGDADVSVTYTYDLETEAERDAFEEPETNETVRERLSTRFENRMAGVAAAASNETGRSMAASGASISAASSDGVGTVTLTVRWTNLAAVDGDRLVVTEPFASGVQPDRTFTVRAPDGDAIADASPDPSSGGGAEVAWTAGESLDGFELVAADGDGEAATDGSAGDGPGFGAVLALSALLGAALLARRGGHRTVHTPHQGSRGPVR